VRKRARIGVLVAGACGLVLAASGTSAAATYGGHEGDGVWDSDTYVRITAELSCPNRSTACVNGALYSGNVRNSQNVYLNGNSNNSGSPNNDNGITNSHDETHAAHSKTANNLQSGGPQHL
jgi:hypothetical protein